MTSFMHDEQKDKTYGGSRLMKKNTRSKEMTITGYVAGNDWDIDDNVAGISIITDDDEYIVDLKGMGEELIDLLDEEVEATGVVRKYKDGSQRITIIDYEVLSEDSFGDYLEDEYEEEDEGDDR